MVLDATASLQRKGLRSEPLLTFHVQLRSRGRLCRPSVLSDLDLSHAYLLALDAAAYRKLLAHRASLLRPSRRDRRPRGGLTAQESVDGGSLSPGGRNRAAPSPGHGEDEQQRAESRNNARMRRQVLPPRPLLRSSSPDCRLVPWRPSLEELGLDSVVYPDTVELNRCSGACRPSRFDVVPVLNHTVMKGLLAAERPSDYVHFCCVPTSFRSITLVYLDSHSATGFTPLLIENISATSCGCR